MTICPTENQKWRRVMMGALVVACLVGGAASQTLALPTVVPPGSFTVWAEGSTTGQFPPGAVTADGTSLTNVTIVEPPSSPAPTSLTLFGGGNANFLQAKMVVSKPPNPTAGGIGFFDVSMYDTYTLSGPAATVPITVAFNLVGDTNRTSTFAIFTVRAQIGTWTQAPTTIDNRVVPFGVSSDAFHQVGVVGSSPTSFHTDITAIHNQNVTAGAPFSLAYQIEIFSSNLGGTFDFFNTGVIDFTLPPGYTITSAGGFGPPAPLPGSVVLMGSGLLSLVGIARWRRS
jgi:hypothetical protein